MRAVILALWAAMLLSTQIAAQSSPPQDPFRARPETYAPRYDPRLDSTGYPTFPYVVIPDDARRARQRPLAGVGSTERTGELRLAVQPVTTQVFVDGFFVGTVDDFRGTGPAVESGTHRVELRARGYESMALDVVVHADRPTVVRRTLTPISLASSGKDEPSDARGIPSPLGSLAPRTFYVVPGCYAGDKPPDRTHLPEGCDASRVRAVPGSGVSRAQQSGKGSQEARRSRD